MPTVAHLQRDEAFGSRTPGRVHRKAASRSQLRAFVRGWVPAGWPPELFARLSSTLCWAADRHRPVQTVSRRPMSTWWQMHRQWPQVRLRGWLARRASRWKQIRCGSVRDAETVAKLDMGADCAASNTSDTGYTCTSTSRYKGRDCSVHVAPFTTWETVCITATVLSVLPVPFFVRRYRAEPESTTRPWAPRRDGCTGCLWSVYVLLRNYRFGARRVSVPDFEYLWPDHSVCLLLDNTHCDDIDDVFPRLYHTSSYRHFR